MESQSPSNTDKIIYQDSNISISNTQLKFKGEIFVVNSIINTEIKVIQSNQIIPWTIIGIGVIALLIGYNTSNFGLSYFGYLPISLGITWLLWFVKKQYSLVIVTQKEKINTVTSKDKNYINLLISVIKNKGEKLSTINFDEKETVFYQDNKVTVSDQYFKFDNKSFAINLINKTKAEFDPNRKKLSIGLILIGIAIFIYYGNQSRADLETIFGVVLTGLGVFFWFKKQYTLRITLDNSETFNSIISKDLSYCKKVDSAIQEAMDFIEKKNLKE